MLTFEDVYPIAQSCYPREGVSDRKQIDCLRLGFELGMNMVDTAEGYADGKSEELIGEAVKGRRERVFLATKFSPAHVDQASVTRALDGSLRRLQTDYIDLYQMHWWNPAVDIGHTMYALDEMVDRRRIRYIGLCNVNLAQLKKAEEASERVISSVQVEYNLLERTCEAELLPYCQQRSIRLLAYSPLGRGRVLTQTGLSAGLCLDWLVTHKGVIAITRSTSAQHIWDNCAAWGNLRPELLEALEKVVSPEVVEIDTKLINVGGRHEVDHNLPIYTSLGEAVANERGAVPTPAEIAEEIKREGLLKPVRVSRNPCDGCETTDNPFVVRAIPQYDLVNGRMRYWGWVIAYGWEKPIPAIVEG